MLSEELYIRSHNVVNKMVEILYKYLILNKKASVPGIGVFHIHRQPASLDFSNKAFKSPSARIAFTEAAVVADKKFYSFLSEEQQIEEAEAVEHFSDFTQSLKENLLTNGSVHLPGFGLLARDIAGRLQFQPAKQLPSFFTDVAAERTIREVSDEDLLADDKRRDNEITEVVRDKNSISWRKNYWWIFAIILAAGAIAAIIYYYKVNGNLR